MNSSFISVLEASSSIWSNEVILSEIFLTLTRQAGKSIDSTHVSRSALANFRLTSSDKIMTLVE